MAITVAFRQRPRPERIGAAVAAIQRSFLEGRDGQLGRQRARLFQRLGDLADLLDVGEWDSREAVERYLSSPRYAEVVATCEGPPLVRYYTPLRWFERVLQPIAVAACATVNAPVEASGEVESYLREVVYEAVIGAPGVRCHQISRALDDRGQFLVVHGWAALEDLEQFRREVSPRLKAGLARINASVDRFTGAVVAEHDRSS